MDSLWRPISEINAIDRKFTNLLKKVRESLKDNFVMYDTYEGYYTNELSEFIADEFESEIFEDPTTENIEVIYITNKNGVKSLMRWLANWDMVALDDEMCSIKNSNHPDVAKVLNELSKLAA